MRIYIMKIVNLMIIIPILISVHSFCFAAETDICTNDDKECKVFEHLSDTRQDEKIIEILEPNKQYSKGSRFYIGLAFMSVAAKKVENLPEQAEQLYRKALEYKYYSAYMGLFNLYVNKDKEIAYRFIKTYLETNPDDSAPYFILGEYEFEKSNYKIANGYLKKSKELSNGHTAGLDWLLFKVNYILGDYKYSSEMLESALAQGRFTEEIKELKKDARFSGIEKNPAFEEFWGWFKDQ